MKKLLFVILLISALGCSKDDLIPEWEIEANKELVGVWEWVKRITPFETIEYLNGDKDEYTSNFKIRHIISKTEDSPERVTKWYSYRLGELVEIEGHMWREIKTKWGAGHYRVEKSQLIEISKGYNVEGEFLGYSFNIYEKVK